MDAVKGIIGGIVASGLILFVGAIALKSDMIQTMTTGTPMYLWLLLNTAITIGQFVFTYIIITQITEAPKQKENATVV